MNVLWSPKRKVKCVAFGMDFIESNELDESRQFPMNIRDWDVGFLFSVFRLVMNDVMCN
jgi:hypothetical protein